MTSSALLEIRPPNPQSLARLIELGKEQHVTIIHATNILERGGELIGYISIGSMPSVHMFFDKNKATPHDYLTAMSYWEGALAANNVEAFWLPCESTSPLMQYVEKLGYIKSNFDNVFAKKLK